MFAEYDTILDTCGSKTKYEINRYNENIRKKVYTSNGCFYYVNVVSSEKEYVLCYLYNAEKIAWIKAK